MAESRAIITAGLGAGDEGKGSIVDFLVRRYRASAVIRYSGGPQAAHHVVAPDGTWHCFSQFGSGTLIPSVRTHLCRSVFIKPQNMISEELSLRNKGITDAFTRLSIDPACPIVTPYHAMIGQMLELERGASRHGSVGMGVGQAVLEHNAGASTVITALDLSDKSMLREKLAIHQKMRIEQAEEIRKRSPGVEMERLFHYFTKEVKPGELLTFYRRFNRLIHHNLVNDEEYLRDLVSQKTTFVCEGSQGALIDAEYGFWPYVTKTKTTTEAAEALIRPFGGRVEVKKLGIARGYSYRHGPGPMVTEDISLSRLTPELHNKATAWQGRIRTGWFDLIAARYAVLANNSVDAVALTHLDRLSLLPDFRIYLSYRYHGREVDTLSDFFRWHRDKNTHPVIEALTLCKNEMSRGRTDLLFSCKPGACRVFKGTPESIESGRSRERLPHRIRRFIEYIAEDRGLGIPVSIVSVGATALQKHEISPLF